jgi:RHS repeat-associated protein
MYFRSASWLLPAILLVTSICYANTPQITSTSPTSGAVGTSVQVYGSGFGATQGSSTISFNGVNATVMSWADGQITATVPSAATGPVQVTVGSVASNVNVYFSVPPPQVTSISPTSGVVGTQVTVNGSGFGPSQGSSCVAFGTFCATSVSSWSATQIVANVPNGTTTGPAWVKVSGAVSNQDVLFSTPNPIVSSVSPTTGPVGTPIQVNGSGFGATLGTSLITVNGQTAAVTSWSDGQIVATIPSTATTGPVQVKVATFGSNANIDFLVPPPQVTSISPSSGVTGNSVTVNGSGFQNAQGSSSISFTGRAAAVISWNNTQIVATVPSGTTTGPVKVTVNNLASNQDVVFTTFTPIVTGLSPASAPGGAQVQINGVGFGNTQGSSSVIIGGYAPSVVSWSNTEIVANTVSYATTGAVTVTVNSVTSNNDNIFTVLAPQITGISPTSGGAGTQVTITGSNFASASNCCDVLFNGKTATINSWSSTQTVATVPSGATTGPVSIYVSSTFGSNENVIFTMPNPVVVSLSPANGPLAAQVQVNGSGFGATQGSSTLSFNGFNAVVTSWSDTQVVATVPNSATTGPVKVTEGGVASNTGVNYNVPPPQVTGISPSSGGVGTQVTITGSNFQAQPTTGYVYFNGSFATIVSWNNTQIVASISSGMTTGGVKVDVNGVYSNQDFVFTIPNPVVTGFSPGGGPIGTPVQINGSGFGSTQGSSTITFNGTAAAVSSWSDSQIAATVPSGAPTGPIFVTEGGVAARSSVYFNVSNIDVNSVSPTAGPTGTQVTVSGVGFGGSQGSSTLSFNGTNATVISTWTDSLIVATVPNGSTTGPVKVVNGGVSSNTTVNFTVGGVVVTSVSPTTAPASTQVQINGSGFGSTQGSVTINGYSGSVVSWSSTQITVTAPNVVTTGPVKVTAGGVASNADVNLTIVGPTVMSVSPTSGPVGSVIQVNGTHFGATQGSSTITFNGVSPTSISSWSNSQIVATVPPSTSGPVVVTVGLVPSNSNLYFSVPLPQITSISPTSGAVGTQVTIDGSAFTSTRGAVLFGASYANASIISWTDTQIVCTVPSNALTGAVWVNFSFVNSNQDMVFALPDPVINTLSPTTGPVATQVTINGSGFGATVASSSVAFNGNNASIVSWSDTQVVATVPSAAITGPVKVTVGGIASNTNVFFAVPAPQVTSISPTSGVVGAQVTINGSGFQSTVGSGSVRFNGSGATINSWSDTQIVAVVPNATTTGAVKVTVNSVASNQNVQFTVPNPVVSGVSPSSGPVGTQVQVNGVGFGATQGSNTVTFNNQAAAVTSWSDSQIVATVPSSATTGVVVVTEGGVASNANIYFTVPAPLITSISPASGGVGTQVTITGSGFQASQGNPNLSYVTFNGSQATVVSWSNAQLVATVPANSGTGPAVVWADGVESNQNIVFTMPNPIITGLVPSSSAVGTQVQINGMGFGASQGSSTISFSTSNSTSGNAVVTSWSDGQIVATVPVVATSGAVTVKAGGMGSNNNVVFTVPAPQLTSITPNIGGSGNTVTIVGSGFQASQSNAAGSNEVTFAGAGGNAPVTSWSDTQIVGTVPNGASTGPVKVFVNGQYSNLVNYTVPANMVTSVSPTSGPVGTQVTVTGSGFGATQGTSALTFNGQLPATITSWSNTQIVAVVPVTATTGPAAVTVNNIPGNINVIYTVPPPAVTAISPAGGVPGTSVTITGSGFQANQRNSTITFNGTVAPITSWSDTQIVAAVPTSASTGPLQVNVNSTSNGSGNIFVVPVPVITSLDPPSGPINGQVIVNGTGFGASTGGGTIASVTFNGVGAGLYSWSDTQIVVQVPGAASSGPVVVNQYDGVSNAVQFTVEAASVVTAVSPTVGPVGSTVTITGSGFGNTQSNSTAQFNGVPGTVTSWSDTEIVATVPPGATTGPVSVNVAGMYAGTVDYVLNTTVHVTDSLGNNSTYTSLIAGGQWVGQSSTGSGCSTCTVRGTLTDLVDGSGNILSHTDELGHVTNYTYDANNNLASQSQQLANSNVTTSYTYNSFAEPLTVTDPLGNITTNTYDTNGNLLTVTTPAPNSSTAASVTQVAYDTKGELIQITDPLGNLTTLTYNSVGLIATIKDAQNNVTTYAYDSHGNRTSVTDALSNQTTFAYDAGDRLTKITYPDQSTVSFAYDSRGRRTSVTDQNGKVTSYAYDDADHLTSVTDAASNVTQYAYDTENNLTSLTDAAGHTTSFTYDPFGRVSQTSFPSTLVESYTYDAVGNLTNKTDRNGHSILYVYDALNRLNHKGYPDSTGVDYVYDLAGKIKQVSDPTGTYAIAYDNMGRLIGTTTTYSFLPGVPLSNSYVYDGNSNRKQLYLPDGSSDTYSYDTLNRLTAMTDSLAGQFNFGYDGLSRRTSLTRPNGVNTSYGYDTLSRLLSVLHQSGANTLDGAAYTYDLAGNRTAKTNKLNNITEQYTYDPQYELTQVVQGATTTESYSYDVVGNRLSSQSMGSYSYNVSNQLTATTAASFTYDNNGNTLSKTDATGTRNYTWDFENRLTSVVMPGTGGTVTFRYDPFGRRIQKAFTQNSTATVTNYVYDGANSIEEVDASGNELARYAQGAGTDEPLAELRSSASGYYEQDGLGSVTSLSGITGTLANSYTYDTFGNLTVSTGTLTNPFQYTARDYDSETGLRYYRARYYDPQTGRFIGEDPVKFGAGINFYEYVENSPVVFGDPLGLQSSSSFSGGIADLNAWASGKGVGGYHSNDAVTSALAMSPAMDDIRTQFKKAGCKNGLYCGEFMVRHVFTTLNLVVQSVGSFCAYMTSIGGGQVQVDAFNEWGLKSLTANPWGNRKGYSLIDMLSYRAPWGWPSSLLNNTMNGPMHRQRFWYHWTEKSQCCGN